MVWFKDIYQLYISETRRQQQVVGFLTDCCRLNDSRKSLDGGGGGGGGMKSTYMNIKITQNEH